MGCDKSQHNKALTGQRTPKVAPDKAITNRLPPTVVSFATVTNTPAFGDMPYFDATFLPGALTFNLLGHEVELLPRTLKLDLQEQPWINGTNYTLSGPGKYQPRKKSRY